ncbi:sulfite reductase [Reticulomyxa filosa]|uniref:Sulfite reductase n=1 Tax=Reticulomyxa filosa TaxID=46433 RepID=X6P526_RETFI|nr:sulfite reductase [Reticulomyxa filosa]|eukprot:ETO33189.1 sulfite reductase [Reticulomyxa filosa]
MQFCFTKVYKRKLVLPWQHLNGSSLNRFSTLRQSSASTPWSALAALVAAATGYTAFSYSGISWRSGDTTNCKLYLAESPQKHQNKSVSASTSHRSTPKNPNEPNPSWQAGTSRLSTLPIYSRDEVMKHSSEDDYWITYFNGTNKKKKRGGQVKKLPHTIYMHICVYDVTKFLDEHPGNRSRLLLARYGNHDISSFWKQLGQHNQPLVHEILERYRVGNLRAEDVIYADVLSPAVDPKLSEERKELYDYAFSYEPFIAETPIEILASDHRYTPVNYHFVRNHFGVPMHLTIDDGIRIQGVGVKNVNQKKDKQSSQKSKIIDLTCVHTYTNEEEEEDEEEEGLWISYRDLYRLPYVEREVLMQCGGHRRREYDKYGETKGSKWDVGALGNTKFKGVLLRDLFKKLGIDVQALYESDKEYHVWFFGADTDPSGENYGVSIPLKFFFLWTGDVMVAYQQNDEALTHDHGWPARIVVPGWVGARSVKWIQKIVISEKECPAETFKKSYRMTSDDKAEIRDVLDIFLFFKNSLNNMHTYAHIYLKKKGGITLKGEAHSGGGRRIIRVDVSIDGGATWHAATLRNSDNTYLDVSKPKERYGQKYNWTKWDILIPIPADYLSSHNKQLRALCRAFDESHNRQPETCQHDIVFNSKGYCANSYHNIAIHVV